MTVPEACKGCAHRYNDYSEGQNCRKIDRKIVLSGGRILEWPGFAVEEAFKECGGDHASPSIFSRFRYYTWL